MVLCEEEWEHKSDDVVRDRPEIQLELDLGHEVSLDQAQCVSVVLKTKRLMFIMDERATRRAKYRATSMTLMMMVMVELSSGSRCDHFDRGITGSTLL